MREEFEKWISSAPFERCVRRYPDGPERVSWPGQYRDVSTELAWQAWQEAWKQATEFEERIRVV